MADYVCSSLTFGKQGSGETGEALGQKVFLVALTGWGQDQDRRRTSEAGFDRHIVNPVDFDHVQAILAEQR